MAESNNIWRLDGTLQGELGDSQKKVSSTKDFSSGNFGSKDTDRVLLHIYDLTENYLGSSKPSKEFGSKEDSVKEEKESPFQFGGKKKKRRKRGRKNKRRRGQQDIQVNSEKILEDIGFSSSEFELEIDYIRLIIGNHPESVEGGLYIESISTARDELILKTSRELSDGSGELVNSQILNYTDFPNGTMAEKRIAARDTGLVITEEGIIDELFLDFDFGRRYQVVNFFSSETDGVGEFGVKLDRPLEQSIQQLEQTYVYQKIKNSEKRIVDLRKGPEDKEFNQLRKPNYDVDLGKQVGSDGSFRTFNDLISTQEDTSDKVLRDVLSGSFGGIKLNIDYSDYNQLNFAMLFQTKKYHPFYVSPNLINVANVLFTPELPFISKPLFCALTLNLTLTFEVSVTSKTACVYVDPYVVVLLINFREVYDSDKSL